MTQLDETRPVKKTAARWPTGLRLLHSIEWRHGTWYAIRLVLDGQGHEVGRSEHPTLNIQVAAELCREDAIKLGAAVFKHMAPLEAEVDRMERAVRRGSEEAAVARGDASRLLAKAAKLREEEMRMREKALTMPARADIPKQPPNLPAHLAMRWEDPRCREDELQSADSVATMAKDAEDAAFKVEREAELLLAKQSDLTRVEEAHAAVAKAWKAYAPKLCEVVWG